MNWHGLLVSVRNAAEARAAVTGGAAIIDVKEPSRGPLGAADPEAAVAVAREVGGRVPWTMACGELGAARVDDALAPPDAAALTARVIDLLAGRAAAPAAVKVGLAGSVGTPWEERLRRLWAAVPPGPERVAVAYADWQRAAAPPPDDVIAAAGRLGCRTLLIDTFDKSSAGIFGCCPARQAAAWVAAARAAGLRVAIAGRIPLELIPEAWALGPDVVAVRSAVCFNGREGTVRADLVRRAVGMGEAAGRACANQPFPAGVRT